MKKLSKVKKSMQQFYFHKTQKEKYKNLYLRK